MKGNALIRAYLGVDPDQLSDEKYAELFAQAIWIEQRQLKNQAELLTALFAAQ
jgi:2-hydroxychromene-2-carboxylate isomerase